MHLLRVITGNDRKEVYNRGNIIMCFDYLATK